MGKPLTKGKKRPQASMMSEEEQLNWPEDEISEDIFPQPEGSTLSVGAITGSGKSFAGAGKGVVRKLREAGFKGDLRTDEGLEKLAEKVTPSSMSRVVKRWKELVYDTEPTKNQAVERRLNKEIDALERLAKDKYGLDMDDLDRRAYQLKFGSKP